MPLALSQPRLTLSLPVARVSCTCDVQEPCYDKGDHRGYYPCCGQQALRFDAAASNKRRGCLVRRHTPAMRTTLECTSLMEVRAQSRLMFEPRNLCLALVHKFAACCRPLCERL